MAVYGTGVYGTGTYGGGESAGGGTYTAYGSLGVGVSLGNTSELVGYVPCPVDPSGGGNVAAAMNAWIATLQPGDIGDLLGLSYRCDQTLLLDGLSGVTLRNGEIWTDDPTGDGSTLEDPSSAARTRSHIRVSGCTDVTIENIDVIGANALGGVGDDAYVADLEAQHAVDVLASTGTTIRGGDFGYVYGDLIYLGGTSGTGPCVNTHIDGVTAHHSGRQGIGIGNATTTLIENCNIGEIRRSLVDLEPASVNWAVDGVTIRDCVFGPKRLTWLASQGEEHVDNVLVEDCTVNAPANVICRPPEGTRRSNWTFRRVTTTVDYGTNSRVAWEFQRVDGLTVEDCNVALQPLRNMYIVGAEDCTDVTVQNNLYPGGVGQLVVIVSATGRMGVGVDTASLSSVRASASGSVGVGVSVSTTSEVASDIPRAYAEVGVGVTFGATSSVVASATGSVGVGVGLSNTSESVDAPAPLTAYARMGLGVRFAAATSPVTSASGTLGVGVRTTTVSSVAGDAEPRDLDITIGRPYTSR